MLRHCVKRNEKRERLGGGLSEFLSATTGREKKKTHTHTLRAANAFTRASVRETEHARAPAPSFTHCWKHHGRSRTVGRRLGVLDAAFTVWEEVRETEDFQGGEKATTNVTESFCFRGNEHPLLAKAVMFNLGFWGVPSFCFSFRYLYLRVSCFAQPQLCSSVCFSRCPI